MLGVSKEKILKRIEDLDIDISHFKSRKTPSVYISRSKVDAIDEETFKMLVENNYTWPKLALACGFKSCGAIKNVARRVESLGLDTSHFHYRRIDNDKLFVVERGHTNTKGIKKRLIRDFDRSYTCAECNNENFINCDGVLMWNKKKIVLQLEHKNGNRTDNRIENLELLCPNCHSQTSTFCGANSKKRKAIQSWLEEGKTCHAPGSIASLLN
jgi:Zn finger protein HypA/HybF involved in hydrogenase expression